MNSRRTALATVQIDLDGYWVLLQFINRSVGCADVSNDRLFATGLPRILELLRAADVRATFFVNAADVTDPTKREMLSQVLFEGHELANHGLDHRYFHQMSFPEKEQQIRESTTILTEFAGCRPAGFRAAGSAVDGDLPLLLERYAYRYDSSTFPTAAMPAIIASQFLFTTRPNSPYPWIRPMFGRLRPYRPSPTNLYRRGLASFLEIPISTFPLMRLPLHFSYGAQMGRGYLLAGIRLALKRVGIINFVFHLLDFADPITDVRFRRVPGIGLPLGRRLDLARAALATLRRRSLVLTTRELVSCLESGSGICQHA